MNRRMTTAAVLIFAGQLAQASVVSATSYATNCYVTSPSPTVPFSESDTGASAFSSDLLCYGINVPYSSGWSQVDSEQVSVVSGTGIVSSGLVRHTTSGLWSGLGTSQIMVTLTPDVDHSYEFLAASGEATTQLEPGFISQKASFLIQLSDTGNATDLLMVTAAGMTGSLTGVLLAGHTYEFRAIADVLDSPLYNLASFDVDMALTAVPAPATAPLLLTALAAISLRRRRVARS